MLSHVRAAIFGLRGEAEIDEYNASERVALVTEQNVIQAEVVKQDAVLVQLLEEAEQFEAQLQHKGLRKLPIVLIKVLAQRYPIIGHHGVGIDDMAFCPQQSSALA